MSKLGQYGAESPPWPSKWLEQSPLLETLQRAKLRAPYLRISGISPFNLQHRVQHRVQHHATNIQETEARCMAFFLLFSHKSLSKHLASGIGIFVQSGLMRARQKKKSPRPGGCRSVAAEG